MKKMDIEHAVSIVEEMMSGHDDRRMAVKLNLSPEEKEAIEMLMGAARKPKRKRKTSIELMNKNALQWISHHEPSWKLKIIGMQVGTERVSVAVTRYSMILLKDGGRSFEEYKDTEFAQPDGQLREIDDERTRGLVMDMLTNNYLDLWTVLTLKEMKRLFKNYRLSAAAYNHVTQTHDIRVKYTNTNSVGYCMEIADAASRVIDDGTPCNVMVPDVNVPFGCLDVLVIYNSTGMAFIAPHTSDSSNWVELVPDVNTKSGLEIIKELKGCMQNG